MRLLELPEDVRERIRAGELSASHGIALARWKEFPKLVSAIAQYVIEKGLAAKQVESFDLSTYELRKSGMVKALDRWDAKFDTEGCKQCPFGAYRRTGAYFAVCLKPEHFDELNQAAIAAHEQQVKVVTANGEIIDRETMNPGDFDQCWGTVPGCDETCPCRRTMTWYGEGQTVPICIDPPRRRALRETDEAERRAYRQERHALRVERINALIDTHVDDPEVMSPASEIDRDLMALVAGVALHTIYDREPIEHAAANRWPKFKPSKGDENNLIPMIRRLRKVPQDAALRLVAEALLRYDLRGSLSYDGATSELVDWFIHEASNGEDASETFRAESEASA